MQAVHTYSHEGKNIFSSHPKYCDKKFLNYKSNYFPRRTTELHTFLINEVPLEFIYVVPTGFKFERKVHQWPSVFSAFTEKSNTQKYNVYTNIN